MSRSHDVRHLTTAELQRAQRDLRAAAGLITPGSPALVPIQAQMQAIDTELAQRTANHEATENPAMSTGNARADDRLTTMAAALASHGLHVTTGEKTPLADGTREDIGVFDLRSGQYADIGYSGTGNNPGEDYLVLTYRTARDKDPDGAHMAGQVIRLLSAPIRPDRKPA